jgi:enoyl-CoA hydratase
MSQGAVRTETPLIVDHDGDVLVLTLNRPEARNAVTLELSKMLAAAFEELDASSVLRAAVLAANGPAFSAGMDLKRFAAGELPIVPGRGFGGLTERGPRKPLIAAVDGIALAGGFELVLASDLVVASRRAVFGLPEVQRGLTANAGGLLRLHERVPYHLAMELILTGRRLPAEEAHRLGLVNRLVPPGTARQAALELAHQIADNAPLAVQASKRVIMECRDWPSAARFQEQDKIVDPVRRSRDAQEGARAFIEKRDPTWTGN